MLDIYSEILLCPPPRFQALYLLLYLPKLPIIFQCQKLLEPLAQLVVECDIFLLWEVLENVTVEAWGLELLASLTGWLG